MFLLRETMQSCEGAMKSLRSDACSAGENLLDDIAGRPGPRQSSYEPAGDSRGRAAGMLGLPVKLSGGGVAR